MRSRISLSRLARGALGAAAVAVLAAGVMTGCGEWLTDGGKTGKASVAVVDTSNWHSVAYLGFAVDTSVVEEVLAELTSVGRLLYAKCSGARHDTAFVRVYLLEDEDGPFAPGGDELRAAYEWLVGRSGVVGAVFHPPSHLLAGGGLPYISLRLAPGTTLGDLKPAASRIGLPLNEADIDIARTDSRLLKQILMPFWHWQYVATTDEVVTVLRTLDEVEDAWIFDHPKYLNSMGGP